MTLRMFRAFRCRVVMKVEVRSAIRLSRALTRDVSVGGLCISGMIRPAVHERLGITLTLPDGVRISVPADVRWVQSEGPFEPDRGLALRTSPGGPPSRVFGGGATEGSSAPASHRSASGGGSDVGVEFVHTPESEGALRRLAWGIESGSVPSAPSRTLPGPPY